jgi:hypothetical protein
MRAITDSSVSSGNSITWYAVVERGPYPGDGRPAPCGPMHAARTGAADTACGQPLASLRPLPAVAFSNIVDAAATMVCGGCRRAVLRDPEGMLG